MIKNLAYILISLLIIGCSSGNENQERKRPSGVPASSQWYGGRDGGSWINIEKTDVPNHFDVQVYFEHDGELRTDGIFKVDEPCSKYQYSVTEIKNSISAFDGVKIILSEIESDRYCTLSPAE